MLPGYSWQRMVLFLRNRYLSSSRCYFMHYFYHLHCIFKVLGWFPSIDDPTLWSGVGARRSFLIRILFIMIGRSLLIGAEMTCIQTIVQPRIHFLSSKLQQTKGSPISIASPLGTLAPARASKVGYNDIDRHTWLGHNFWANALEDIGANHLVFGVLACQGTRSAINFRPGGERYCQTLGYSYPQGQPLCILVVFHGICQGAWSHEKRRDGGNDGELHDEDK